MADTVNTDQAGFEDTALHRQPSFARRVDVRAAVQSST